MNLLYKGYRKGCYVGLRDGQLVDYRYGYSSTMACYYADLQPNTTYTLKPYDSSSRMRVATFTYDVKHLTGSEGFNDSIVQTWLSDSTNAITFTTGVTDIYLVVYYTNDSEYDTRIMLNEGSIADEYEAPITPLFAPVLSETLVTNFEQGEFNVNTGNFYNSTTDVRSGLSRINPCKISVDCDEGTTWTFICYDGDFSFIQINESSGFKSSGEVIDISSYSWIRYIRIELHDTNGISPPAECTLHCAYGFKQNENEDIIPTLAQPLPDKVFQSPYPKNLYRLTPIRRCMTIYHDLMPDIKTLGAFSNCTNLSSIVIPESVKHIGEFAFTNTTLTSVTIARDCTYYPTSFPIGCIINFYD